MNEVFKIKFKFWQNDKVDQGLSLWNEGASVFTISAIMTLNPDDNSCDTLKEKKIILQKETIFLYGRSYRVFVLFCLFTS